MSIKRIFKDAKHLKKIDIRSYQSSLYESLNLFGMACTNSLEHLILPDSNLSEADNDYLADAIVSKVFKIFIFKFRINHKWIVKYHFNFSGIQL